MPKLQMISVVTIVTMAAVEVPANLTKDVTLVLSVIPNGNNAWTRVQVVTGVLTVIAAKAVDRKIKIQVTTAASCHAATTLIAKGLWSVTEDHVLTLPCGGINQDPNAMFACKINSKEQESQFLVDLTFMMKSALTS
jgi:hypothetical protein